MLTEYDDGTSPSTGTIIKNNIIYSSGTSPYMIQVNDNASLTGLQCDYNVYYVSGGNPMFITNANVSANYLTFAQWQALGYDLHSVVINPNLNSSLVPAAGLFYGQNLGSTYQTGIDPANTWNRTNTLTKNQGSTWECGAFIK